MQVFNRKHSRYNKPVRICTVISGKTAKYFRNTGKGELMGFYETPLWNNRLPVEKMLLADQICENSGKPVWKEIPLNDDAVENLVIGERTRVVIIPDSDVGIAQFYFT